MICANRTEVCFTFEKSSSLPRNPPAVRVEDCLGPAAAGHLRCRLWGAGLPRWLPRSASRGPAGNRTDARGAVLNVTGLGATAALVLKPLLTLTHVPSLAEGHTPAREFRGFSSNVGKCAVRMRACTHTHTHTRAHTHGALCPVTLLQAYALPAIHPAVEHGPGDFAVTTGPWGLLQGSAPVSPDIQQ